MTTTYDATYDAEKDPKPYTRDVVDDRDSSASRGADPILSHFSEAEQRSIVHKIDKRLIPMAGVMYCVSLLDRTNLGAANIAG